MALVAKVGLDKSSFSTGLASLKSEVSKFSSEIGGMLAGGFAVGSIFQGLKGAIEQGGKLTNSSYTLSTIRSTKAQILET